MDYWLDTIETIPKGVGFSHFDTMHLIWLGIFAVFTLLSCIAYQRLGRTGRKRMRQSYAGLIVADELFKVIVLIIGKRYRPDYLPLQLCSINIFIIVYHTIRPNRMLDNFLYVICIPGALAALLFPGWTPLPAANFLNIHSFTTHILLAAYPIMLLAGGEIKPEIKYVPKCLLLLIGFAIIALCANLVLGTNFMFLMYAGKDNPLRFFQDQFGSHLIGYPIIISCIIAVMYGPILIHNRKKPK